MDSSNSVQTFKSITFRSSSKFLKITKLSMGTTSSNLTFSSTCLPLFFFDWLGPTGWLMSEAMDESGAHHLACAAANIMFLYTYEISEKGKDNRTILDKDVD